jgi:hypothetical protein
VQFDLFYRTGLFASIVSIGCLAIACYSSARLVLLATGSRVGAITCCALLMFNPNLLYLHTTPMTEPLLLATTFLVVLWLVEWVHDQGSGIKDQGSGIGDQGLRMPAKLAGVLFAAMWTRYEAWPVVTTAVAAVTYVTWRRHCSLRTALRTCARLAIWPALAVAIFLFNSRITVGAWFVSDGFYVPDPTYAHQSWRTLVGIWWGTHQLSGYLIETVALFTAAIVAWRALVRKQDAALLVTLSLFATAALPLTAFYDGHPYRIRYMIPTVAACALFCGLAVGLISTLVARTKVRAAGEGMVRVTGDWRSGALATILIGSLFVESPVWNLKAPMLVEAQWDRGASIGRRQVTA